MICEKEQKIYDILDSLNIKYIKFQHDPVYTVEEVNNLNINIPGMALKNLFLKNKKGNKHYLVIVEESKRVDLKELSLTIKASGLSFASEERLEKHLGLKPGAVTPLGLINDKEKNVEVILDEEIKYADKVSFHPNVNTATILIDYCDFEKYLNWCKNEYKFSKM